MLNSLSTRTPQVFSAVLLSSQSLPRPSCYTRSFSPRCTTCICLSWMSWGSCRPAKVPLNRTLAFQCIHCFAQFSSICKLTESTLYTITQAANEDIKQYWPQYQAPSWVTDCQLNFVLYSTPIEVNGPATLLPTHAVCILAVWLYGYYRDHTKTLLKEVNIQYENLR